MRYRAITIHQRPCRLVVKLLTLVLDVLIPFRQALDRLATVRAALLLAGNGSLCAAQLLLRPTVEPGRRDRFPATGDKERLQPQVDPDRRGGRWLVCRV